MEKSNQVSDTLTRYCLYARKSSESDERQAISIESQINEMKKIAELEKLKVVQIYRESHSAKKCNQRPIFLKLITEIESGRYNGIITWSADRLSRNAGDLGQLVDLIDEGKLQTIVTFSQKFTNNPNEKFLLMILGSQAKLENDNRSLNVKRGIRNTCEKGLWPGQLPLGYESVTLNRVRSANIDPKRGELIKKVFERIANGQSVKSTIKWINTETSLRTRNNKYIPKSVIYQILRNTFYYGEFTINDIKYKGNHKPLITQELFDEVQKKLRPFRNTHKRARDDFSLCRFLKCAKCGSSVHRSNKLRRLLSGETHYHVYYRCSKEKNHQCSSKYVSEEELLRTISTDLESTDVSKIVFPDYLQDEIARFERMRWDIYARMNEGTIKLMIYPLRFEEIDETTIRMYLQNMILYAKPDKRYFLISLLLTNGILSNKHLLLKDKTEPSLLLTE